MDTNTDITAEYGASYWKAAHGSTEVSDIITVIATNAQRELHAIHEVRSLTDTDNIPPSVLGNLHSLDPLQQVAACKRVQQQIKSWISAPLKDILNEAIDWAEEQTYETLTIMTRRTPLTEPKLDSSGTIQMMSQQRQAQQFQQQQQSALNQEQQMGAQ